MSHIRETGGRIDIFLTWDDAWHLVHALLPHLHHGETNTGYGVLQTQRYDGGAAVFRADFVDGDAVELRETAHPVTLFYGRLDDKTR